MSGVQLGNAWGKIEIGTGDAEQEVASLAKTLRNSGMVLSAAISAPLAVVGKSALAMAADFEQSLNIMQQVTGATDGQMQMLQDQALQLGADTVFGAGDAAEAMLELAKAGMTVEEASAAISGVMDLAAASGAGLGQAATIAASALNTFGLDASESARVADLLAAGANASAAEITDLAQGLQQGGFAFDMAGQNVDDLVASLAILTNVGLTGSDAGTSLKNAFIRLMNPTKEAAAAMASVGFEAYDAHGNMKPLSQIIGEINVATAGMTAQQRDAFLSTVFMSDGMKAMIPLLDEGESGFLAMKDAVNQGGAATEVAAARMSGFWGAAERVRGSIESLLIDTILPWLESMSGVGTQISEVIDWFNALSTPVKNAALGFAIATAAVGPLMLGISALGTVLGAIFSPVTLMVGAVVALAAAWTMNLGGIRDYTLEVWSAVLPTLTQWWGWVQAVLPSAFSTLQSSATTAWSGVGEAVTGAWAGMQPTLALIQTGVATLSALWAPAIERIRTAFAGLPASFAPMGAALNGLRTAFGNLWTAAQPLLQGLGTALGAVFGVTGLALLNTFAAVLGALGAVVVTVINEITLIINTIASVLTSLTATVLAIAAGDWTAAWMALQDAFTAVWELIKGTIENLAYVVEDVLNLIVEAVTTTLEDLGVDVEQLLGDVKDVWDTIWGGFTGVIDTVTGAVDGVKAGIQAFIDWITGIEIPNPFAAINDSITNIREKLPGWMPGSMQGHAEGTNWFQGGMQLVGERGPELVVSPPGSGVLTAGQTARRLSGAGAGGDGTINVNFGDVTLGSEMDIHRVAYQVAGLIKQFSR